MKSKVLIGFIISYSLVLIVPIVLISFMIYGQFVNILTDEVKNSTKGMLSQIGDVVDVRLQEMDSLSTQISMNPKIQTLLYSTDIENESDYPNFYNAVQELRNYQSTNVMLYNIFILFKGSNVVISNESKYKYDTIFSKIFTWTGMDQTQLYQQLNNIDKKIIKSSTPFSVNNNSVNVITYIQPLPKSSSSYKATLFMTINESMIKQLAQNVLGEYSGAIYILDSQDNILSSIDPGSIAIQNESLKVLMSSLKERKNDSYKVGNSNYIISTIQSKTSNWRYVSVIPSNQILNKVNYVKTSFALIMLASVIIGSLIAFGFLRVNYRKVKKIHDSITAYKPKILQEYTNEWEFINTAINSYVNENGSLLHQLKEQIPVMRNNFFNHLLKGRFYNIDQLKSMLALLNLKIECGPFAVILLNLDSYKHLNYNNLEPTYQDVLRTTVSNAAEKLCSQIGRGYTVDVDTEYIAVLVELDVNSETDYNELLKKVGIEICKFVIGNFGFSTTAGISNVYGELLFSGSAFVEASTALDYRMIKGENTAICFNEVVGRIGNRYYYTFLHEKYILTNLRTGDYEALSRTLKDIIEVIKNEPTSLDVVKCECFAIVNTALKSINELGIETGEVQYRLPSLVKAKTIDEIYEEVCKFYFNICEQVQKSKSYKSIELMDKVIKYLNDNNTEKLLSVEFLAERFFVSSSYMSRIFKERMGSNLIDYLHELRLKKAKNLLSCTGKTVGVIADEVGYNSLYNFTRVFKRYEKVTPTEYRISVRAGNHAS